MERGRPRRFHGSEELPRPVSELLEGWLASQGLSELKPLATIKARWAELVGEDVARHCAPRSLRDGVLLVAVDHGGWSTELTFQEGRIIRLLEDQLGAGIVERLDARVDGSHGLEWG